MHTDLHQHQDDLCLKLGARGRKHMLDIETKEEKTPTDHTLVQMKRYVKSLTTSHNPLLLLPPPMLPSRPRRRLWQNHLLQPQPRRINRARSRIDEQIIQKRAKRAAQKRRHHGNPKVVPARRPHLRAVADGVAHQPRTEVARNVDCVAGLPAETGAQAENEEEET